MADEAQVLQDLAPLLERELAPEPWEWGAIGDNTLAAWNWAKKLERDYGVDHQAALRFVKRNYVPDADGD